MKKNLLWKIFKLQYLEGQCGDLKVCALKTTTKSTLQPLKLQKPKPFLILQPIFSFNFIGYIIVSIKI